MPTQTHPTSGRALTQALVDAAAGAGYAPSIHDVQPWRWRVRGARLDLFADHARTLAGTDPDRRLATLSCGIALHHARIGLAAQGWRVTVTRIPDPTDRSHLAQLRVLGRAPVELQAVRRTHTIRLRRTDHRPVTGPPVGPDDLLAITAAALADGAWLSILRPDQLADLATAAGHAQQSGIAAPSHDFGHHGDLPITSEHDQNAVYAVLYGHDDGEVDWLRAGEALSSAWLTATELGVSVLPHSTTAEAAGTRPFMRRLVAGRGHPYLLLRLGMRRDSNNDAGLTHVPRVPAHQTIDRPRPKASPLGPIEQIRSSSRAGGGRHDPTAPPTLR